MRAVAYRSLLACAWLVAPLGCANGDTAPGDEPTTCSSAFDCEPSQACLGGTCREVDPIRIVTESLPSGETGELYLATLEATGGVGQHVWALDEAPAWLAIDELSGELSGTPDSVVLDGASVAVAVADIRDNQDHAQLTLVVRECRPGVEVTCAVPDGDRCLVGGLKTCDALGEFGPCDATGPSADPSTCGHDCGSCDAELAPSCVDGLCTCDGSPCAPPESCCDDSCVDLLSDADHCGRCELTCQAPNTEMRCAVGECVMDGCASDAFADCDPLVPGCETDLRVSDEHCGTCNAPCAPDAAQHIDSASCQGRTCVIASCESGWADCDAMTPGCETDITSASACGGCAGNGGQSCYGSHVTAATCEQGACVPTCDLGWDDCDDDPTDCERPLGTDTDCTTCDHGCAASRTCRVAYCIDSVSGCDEIDKPCNDNDACTNDDCDVDTGECVYQLDLARYCADRDWDCGTFAVSDCAAEEITCVCPIAGQVCTTANSCCTPASPCAPTSCGTVLDNCGQPVDCGGCGTCQTCAGGVCEAVPDGSAGPCAECQGGEFVSLCTGTQVCCDCPPEPACLLPPICDAEC